MASHHIITIIDAHGNVQTGKYVFIYQHGEFTDPSKRLQATDLGNGNYAFDTDHPNLTGAASYDIGVYNSIPSDHAAAWAGAENLLIATEEKENRYFGAQSSIALIEAHVDDKLNPHQTTLTQAIGADTSAESTLTVSNLNTLTNGSDASALHSHSNAVANEVVASGDGATTTFSLALSKYPIVPKTITITDGIQILKDDGAGSFTGDGTGSINYSDGTGSITFNTPPSLGTNITANYNYSKYLPEAHATTHEEGGADQITVTNAMIPESGMTGALRASKIRVIDTGNYYTKENVEDVLQEIAENLFMTLPTPSHLTGYAEKSIGGHILTISFFNVQNAQAYSIEITDLETSKITIHSLGARDPSAATGSFREVLRTDVAPGPKGWEIRVRAEAGLIRSPWSDYYTILPEFEVPELKLFHSMEKTLFSAIEKDSEGKPTVQLLHWISQFLMRPKAEFYIYGPDGPADKYIGSASDQWEEVVERTFDRPIDIGRLILNCLFFTDTEGAKVELKMKIFYSDGSTEESSVASSTKTVSDGGQWISLNFELSKGITGQTRIQVFYRGTETVVGYSKPTISCLGILAKT